MPMNLVRKGFQRKYFLGNFAKVFITVTDHLWTTTHVNGILKGFMLFSAEAKQILEWFFSFRLYRHTESLKSFVSDRRHLSENRYLTAAPKEVAVQRCSVKKVSLSLKVTPFLIEDLRWLLLVLNIRLSPYWFFNHGCRRNLWFVHRK